MTVYFFVKNTKREKFVVAADNGLYTIYTVDGQILDVGFNLRALIAQYAGIELVYFREGYNNATKLEAATVVRIHSDTNSVMERLRNMP